VGTEMEVREEIIRKVKSLPDEKLAELLSFINFLEKKEELILSETSLKKDWLREEEEEAWKEL
jgi:hypothetical protein